MFLALSFIFKSFNHLRKHTLFIPLFYKTEIRAIERLITLLKVTQQLGSRAWILYQASLTLQQLLLSFTGVHMNLFKGGL